MSPVTRLAWWWLRWRGWAVQMNDPQYGGFDKRTGWRPLYRSWPCPTIRAVNVYAHHPRAQDNGSSTSSPHPREGEA